MPWKDWNEWTEVKSLLYVGDDDQEAAKGLIEGLGMVDVWRARGGLPHSIESTVCLMQIVAADKEATANSSSENGGGGGSVTSPLRSELDLRMSYSLAIIRAINGLVDPSQKGLYADSVMSIAAARGIPSWIVELRHDGTHNQLPSLSVLRAASKHMIKWFYDNYWEVQHQHIKILMEGDASSSSSSSSGRINRNVLEALGEACNTGITGIFVPNILLGGGRDPGRYYGDFVDSPGGASRVFEHMCRSKSTAVIDAVIARLFVCAMDEMESYMNKGSPEVGETESLLATLITSKDLLDKAVGPWETMHSANLGGGKEATAGQQAVQDLHVPMTLLKAYWLALLSRAGALDRGLAQRVPEGAASLFREMTSRFRALVQVLAAYSGQQEEKEGGERGDDTAAGSGKGRKRTNEEVAPTNLPRGWTLVEPGAGGAWPLGMGLGSTLT